MKLNNRYQKENQSDSEDNEPLNPNADAAYNPTHWIKCEFNSKTKRFYEPPKTLPELIELFKQRFRDLDEQLQKYQREMNEKEEDLNRYLNIGYIDSEEEENEIDETNNLLHAYVYGQKRESRKVLKMVVRVRDRKKTSELPNQQLPIQQVEEIPAQESFQKVDNPIQQQEVQQQVAPPQVDGQKYWESQFFDRVSGDLEEQKKQWENKFERNRACHQVIEQQVEQEQVSMILPPGQSEIIIQQKEVKESFELPHNEEIKNQELIMQQIQEQKQKLQQQEEEDEKMARDLEMRDQFKLNKEISDNMQQQIKPKPLIEKLPSWELPAVNNDQVMNQSMLNQSQIANRPANIFSKLNLIVNLTCDKIQKPDAPYGRKFTESKRQKFFKWISNLMDKVPNNKQLMAVACNGKEFYVKGLPNTYVQLVWEIKNESNQKWDKQNILRNYCSDDAHVRDLIVTQKLKPNEMMRLSLKVKIPQDVQGKDKIILQFKLENSRRENFGDSLIGIIDLSPISSLDESVVFDNPLVHEQVAINQSIMGENENFYFQASELSDKGYGTFDRCLSILTACKGNTQEAQKILSKLMIKENKE